MATIPELTDKLIRECIQRGDASIACGDGLRLVRLPSGNYAWQYNYRRPDKKQKTISYGKYPLATFAKARERHAQARMHCTGERTQWYFVRKRDERPCKFSRHPKILSEKWLSSGWITHRMRAGILVGRCDAQRF